MWQKTNQSIEKVNLAVPGTEAMGDQMSRCPMVQTIALPSNFLGKSRFSRVLICGFPLQML
jgi:hypothetical protein